MKILNRRSNTINLSTFWENFMLGKFNFQAPYQREDNVWSIQKKSFLMDTIMKNFPIPPIFLHELIDEDGKTVYDVIDGKQRLTAIREFIENKISLPIDFGEDGFGEEELNGFLFKDLPTDDKKTFWKYEISIEYIDTDEVNVVNNLFDRLNRNGEPLNAQELRKAKYGSSELYKLIVELSDNTFWTKTLFTNLDKNRYEHLEYTSELVALLINKEVKESNKKSMDDFYDYNAPSLNNVDVIDVKKQFLDVTKLLNDLNLDYIQYKINSVSHLYGLWGFVWALYQSKNTNNYSHQINDFYTKLRNKNDDDENIKEYRISMQSGTKSKGYRIRRINALLAYCKLASL